MSKKNKKTDKLSQKEQRVEDWFEIPMLYVTVLLVFTLLIPIIFSLPTAWNAIFAFVNLLIWLTFYIELFTKMYVAENKTAAAKRNWSLLLIAIAPLFTPFRFMRISRLVRLVRFMRIQQHVSKLKAGAKEFIYNVEYVIITILSFVLISGLIIWQIEFRFDGAITTLPDALWWAVVTITTIGYGDIIPTSPEGKIAGAGIGIIGAVFFMVFVARIASLFIQGSHTKKLEKLIKNNNLKA